MKACNQWLRDDAIRRYGYTLTTRPGGRRQSRRGAHQIDWPAECGHAADDCPREASHATG